ncbi:MAG TPA: hypothetical protein VGG29_19005 [Caulobacteraceae bacterium]|jgi:hypothetical protein
MAGAAAGALALAAAGAAGGATPAVELFYQRALMSAAGAACRLFAPDVAGALAASKAQARGAALRSGVAAGDLAMLEQRAQVAAGTAGCASPDIAAGAERVRAAFVGYAHLDRMDFPGELSRWSAVRPAADGGAHWAVSQQGRFGWDQLQFGVVSHGAGRPLMAVASFADGAAPSSARLVMRDAAETSGPYLDPRVADLAGRVPIDGRLPPRSATRVFAAEAMSPAGADLRAPGMADAWAFRFPAAAAEALAGLDPREAVAVEFTIPGDDGDTVRTAYLEVGDFAAARAFASIAQR